MKVAVERAEGVGLEMVTSMTLQVMSGSKGIRRGAGRGRVREKGQKKTTYNIKSDGV